VLGPFGSESIFLFSFEQMEEPLQKKEPENTGAKPQGLANEEIRAKTKQSQEGGAL